VKTKQDAVGYRKKRKPFWLTLCAVTVVLAASARAQPVTRKPRVSYLTVLSAASDSNRIEAFRRGLRDLGYMEGKNIIFDVRSTGGKTEGLRALVSEVLQNNTDVILTGGPTATRPAKQATSTIPIVMAQDNDPVGNGFVVSLARPGGNITGLSSYTTELNGKRVELLKEIVPRLARVAVLGTSTNPGNAQALKETEDAARGFSVKLQYLEVRDPKEFETAFRAAAQEHAEAILMLATPVFNFARKQFAEQAAKSRLPVIYPRTEFVEAGGLMTYGTSVPDLYRRAATYVDKIFKGAKPADLPVEQPTKFELVINLKAAKQIGLTIPPNVLARADRVIR